MRTERGFTLLETLVALAIIGIALGAAIRASVFGAERARDLQQRTLGGWVASNVVNEVLATRSFPDMGAAEGRSREGNFEFTWVREIGPTPNLSFRRMEVKVSPADAPDEIVARQITYVSRVTR
ncbi:MAG: type II secretion system minor pseudopilin GspI [Candidatus Dactylopiibacterium sp.]|nr:type II secretion system minor pseudopilin GspI [Candidatus Dactylopiibacterium sp.]